jgi:hypothetical protein
MDSLGKNLKNGLMTRRRGFWRRAIFLGDFG